MRTQVIINVIGVVKENAGWKGASHSLDEWTSGRDGGEGALSPSPGGLGQGEAGLSLTGQ